MNILIISQLDAYINDKEMRMNHLINALKKETDCKIVLLTSQYETNVYHINHKKYNFKIVRFTPIFRIFYLIFKNFKLKGKNNINKNNINKEQIFIPMQKPSYIIGLLSQISFFLGSVTKSLKIIKEENIDLIYGYEIYGAFSGWILSKLTKKPLVVKYQGSAIGPLYNRSKFYLLSRYPEHVLALSRKADLIFMTNDGTKGDKILAKYNNKCIFRFNEIPKPIYKNENVESNKYFLTVSRLENWKRVDRAILAFREFLNLNNKYELIIVGSGNDKKILMEMCTKFDINNKVRFMGWLDYKAVSKLMSNATALLSLYDNSNLCNPVIEAIAHNLPIITIDDGSLDGILLNDYNSILIKKNKNMIKNISEKMFKITENKYYLKKLKSNLKKTSEIFMDEEEKYKSEIYMLKNIIKNRGNI